ncbi:MAG: hypothetical protein PF638_13675, partial [Candidatus Delongbacteria bacterium]|nr:hypothetical protein [Candidatus Delongbacteria bacterium]
PYTMIDLISELIDEENFNIISEKYNEKVFDEGYIKLIYNNLVRIDASLSEEFKIFIKKELSIDLVKPIIIDREEINRQKKQGEFDLLFDKQKLKRLCLNVFDKFTKDDILKKDLFDLKKEHWKFEGFDEAISDAVINCLSWVADTNGKINKYIFKDSFENHIESYLINEIYNEIHSFKEVVISEEQKNYIYMWCCNHFEKVEFTTAISRSLRNDQLQYTVVAVHMWFFYKKFEFKFPQNILLDMLSFDYFIGNGWSGVDDIIKKLPKADVQQRILDNLKRGILDYDVLMNHINYVIRNNITDAYKYIFDEIKGNNRTEYDTRELIDIYFDKTVDYIGLYGLLKIPDKINWYIIEKLLDHNEEIQIEEFLVQIINEVMDKDTRLKSAQYLIHVQNKIGLDYYIKYLKQPELHQVQLENTKCLVRIKTKEFIPDLIGLLELSYQKEIKIEPFYTFTKIVMDAFVTIALVSEELYVEIRQQLITLLDTKSDKYTDLKYIRYDIDRMDKRFRETHVKTPTIDEVKQILEELGL